jgi:hypothetical protein
LVILALPLHFHHNQRNIRTNSLISANFAARDVHSLSKMSQMGSTKTTRGTPNKYFIWGHTGNFPERLKATYRRKNQRGPLARALIRADLPSPCATLEGLVGGLAEFRAERPPDRWQDMAGALEPNPPVPPPLARISHRK